MKHGLGVAAGVALVIAALPELAHGIAGRLGPYGTPAGHPARSEAIIVLGCPTRDDGSLDPAQRWRCAIALRTMNPRVRRVVFTGTTAATGRSEAETMAAHAREIGIPDGVIVLEEQARSTVENLEFSAPLVEGFDVLRIVSDPLHARRARSLLQTMRPDLAARLAPASDHRLFERPGQKARSLIYELVASWVRWRAAARQR